MYTMHHHRETIKSSNYIMTKQRKGLNSQTARAKNKTKFSHDGPSQALGSNPPMTVLGHGRHNESEAASLGVQYGDSCSLNVHILQFILFTLCASYSFPISL